MNGEDFSKVNYPNKVCLIIGNEGNGLSRIVREACDFIVSIPMQGKVNSLNASVAAGILLYGIVLKKYSKVMLDFQQICLYLLK